MIQTLTITAFGIAALSMTSCTTPTDPTAGAYLEPPGQSPREFMRSEQRPFLTQGPTNTQIQAATAGISTPAP